MEARGTVEGTKVTVDITTTFPDVTVVVSVVASLTGEDVGDDWSTVVGNRLGPVTTGPTKADEDAADEGTELLVVIVPVLVGGAILSSHSVVPLMTE
jgi:hypothetical protein